MSKPFDAENDSESNVDKCVDKVNVNKRQEKKSVTVFDGVKGIDVQRKGNERKYMKNP